MQVLGKLWVSSKHTKPILHTQKARFGRKEFTKKREGERK